MDAPQIHTKKLYKYNQIEFWAEDGFIKIYDGRDGSEKAEPTTVMRKRAKALFEEASRATYVDEKKALMGAARDIMLCIQEAQEQGDPTNPKTAAELAYDNRRIWSTGASVTDSKVTKSGIVLG
jgi:hypothetical protein